MTFTWVDARQASFGAVNADQNFVGGDETGLVRINDARVVEGDAGETQISFTVRRGGGLGEAASVDWLLNLTGSADQADFKAGQPLSGQVSFAPGQSAATITLTVTGDTVGEPSETFAVRLANPVGNIAITDGEGVGTIQNDDPLQLKIFEIQGEAQRSPFEGQPVITTGIVTAIAGRGFYIQDAAGDGNARTSDAVFVFTGSAPTVAIGDGVQVRGTVSEFQAGAANLTTTELLPSAITVLSSGNALPAAVLIGEGGLTPPTETIDDDNVTSFDPQTDGLDFYESLEGMRVTVDSPLVIAATNGSADTWVLASGGKGATGLNTDGDGVVIAANDFNPERILIDANGLGAVSTANYGAGDILSDVTGVLSYGSGNFRLLVSEPITLIKDAPAPAREITTLDGDRNHLTVASYNLENIDPTDSQAKFDILAKDIVLNLSAPDILGVQEIQDADGSGNGSNLSGAQTAAKLIAAIQAAGGPGYVYVEIAPATANSSGGEGGGNIRNGYFYNPERVSLVEGSLALIQDAAYNGTRKPLVATFNFNGENVTLINVHFTSRGGSDPLFGSNQPPSNAGDAAREAQATAVANYVGNLLAANPSLKLGVLGDLNGFYFEPVST
jgi:predicted extracellular nuclease